MILVHARQIGPPETGVVHGDAAASPYIVERVERPPEFEHPPGLTYFGKVERGEVVFRFFVERELERQTIELSPYPRR